MKSHEQLKKFVESINIYWIGSIITFVVLLVYGILEAREYRLYGTEALVQAMFIIIGSALGSIIWPMTVLAFIVVSIINI